MPKKSKHVKSNSSIIDKFATPAKLTKQQKRDLKRNNAAAVTSQQAPDTSNPTTVKLTKQQKRDLKRNAKARESSKQNVSEWSQEHPSSTSIAAVEPTIKASVYRRNVHYPPLYLTETQLSQYDIPQDRFVGQNDDCYESVIDSAYQGFSHAPTDTFSRSFHSRFERAMVGLEKEEAYQYDVTQPAGLGTKTAMTYVTRCVVGDPGTTYKYLGLRMFSIPWTKGSVGSSDSSVEIGRLNQMMISKSEELLAKRGKDCGSCQYNLTLINR